MRPHTSNSNIHAQFVNVWKMYQSINKTGGVYWNLVMWHYPKGQNHCQEILGMRHYCVLSSQLGKLNLVPRRNVSDFRGKNILSGSEEHMWFHVITLYLLICTSTCMYTEHDIRHCNIINGSYNFRSTLDSTRNKEIITTNSVSSACN